MKKIFTFLFILSIALSAFGQEALEILFLQDQIPLDDVRDGFTQPVLEDFGFVVTMADIDDAPTEGYDLALIHEGVGSSSAGLKRYNETPMPLVLLKPWNVGSTGLGWTMDKGNFDNSSAVIIIEMMHPILTDLPYFEDLKVGEEIVVAEDLVHDHAVGWVPIAAGDGVSIIGENGNELPNQPALLAIEAGTTLNGVTLENRAVILAYAIPLFGTTEGGLDVKLTESGLKILENSCYWVAGKEIPGSGVSVSDVTSPRISVYPNPSSGMVKMKLDQTVPSLGVEVSGIDGRVLFSKQYHNTGFVELDLTGLHPGIYFICLEGPDISYTERLIIK
jgi:hypothetical protein